MRGERWLFAVSLLMLYWIAGFAGFVIGAAVFYGYLVLTARPDPYEGSSESAVGAVGASAQESSPHDVPAREWSYQAVQGIADGGLFGPPASPTVVNR